MDVWGENIHMQTPEASACTRYCTGLRIPTWVYVVQYSVSEVCKFSHTAGQVYEVQEGGKALSLSRERRAVARGCRRANGLQVRFELR